MSLSLRLEDRKNVLQVRAAPEALPHRRHSTWEAKGLLGISWGLSGLKATVMAAFCDFIHEDTVEQEAEESKELGWGKGEGGQVAYDISFPALSSNPTIAMAPCPTLTSCHPDVSS